MLNFSNFKAVETANTRDNSHLIRPKGQSFNFKFKKAYGKDQDKNQIVTSAFTLSNAMFEKLGLDSKGLIEIVSPEGKSYLAVVDTDNAVFLKGSKKSETGNKSKAFKSTLLEKSLAEQGLINDTLIGTTQKLDLNLVEGSENAMIGDKLQSYGVYEIAKAADATLSDEEKAEDASHSTEATTTEAALQADTAPAAATTNSVEDDF